MKKIKLKKIDYVNIFFQIFLLSSLFWFKYLSWETQQGLGYLFGLLSFALIYPIAFILKNVFHFVSYGFHEILISMMLHVFIICMLIRTGFINPVQFFVNKRYAKFMKEYEKENNKN